MKLIRALRAVYVRLPPAKKGYAKIVLGAWMALTVAAVVMIVGIVDSSWGPNGHIDRFGDLALVGMAGVVASLALFAIGLAGVRRRSA